MWASLTENWEVSRGEHGLDGLAVGEVHASMVVTHPIYGQVCSRGELG